MGVPEEKGNSEDKSRKAPVENFGCEDELGKCALVANLFVEARREAGRDAKESLTWDETGPDRARLGRLLPNLPGP